MTASPAAPSEGRGGGGRRRALLGWGLAASVYLLAVLHRTSLGVAGLVGNVLATLPLALVLRHAGWTAAFGTAALVSLVAAGAVALLLPDRTPRPRAVRGAAELRAGVGGVWSRVRAAWALPGTRLGF